MRKMVATTACLLVCLALLSGCASDKDAHSDSGLDNAVEVQMDTQGKTDIEFSSDNHDIVYDFKDPENADSIVVTPREY